MKLIYAMLLFFAGVFLTSCYSSIKVRVDALNMPAFRETYLYKLDYLNKMEKQLQLITSTEYQQQLKDGVLGEVIKAIDNEDIVPIKDRAATKDDVKKLYDSVITPFFNSAKDLLANTIQLKENPEQNTLQDDHKQKLGSYMANQKGFRNMREEIKKLLLGDFPDPVQLKNVLDLYDEIVANSNIATSAFGKSIISDPMASIIAALPKHYWQKYKTKVNVSFNGGDINQKTLGDRSKYKNIRPSRYNLTVARTLFGNSDIAIKMQTPGEFIVKGVRVDADEAVRASFKVVSQGIKYLAFASGIPVGETSTSQKKTRIPILDSLDQKSTKLLNLKQQYNVATEAFLSVLISVSADLNATVRRPGGRPLPEMKQEALDRIKTAFIVYKNNLSIQ